MRKCGRLPSNIILISWTFSSEGLKVPFMVQLMSGSLLEGCAGRFGRTTATLTMMIGYPGQPTLLKLQNDEAIRQIFLLSFSFFFCNL